MNVKPGCNYYQNNVDVTGYMRINGHPPSSERFHPVEAVMNRSQAILEMSRTLTSRHGFELHKALAMADNIALQADLHGGSIADWKRAYKSIRNKELKLDFSRKCVIR